MATDFGVNEVTDFLRANLEYDAEISGAMKRANVAEDFGLDVQFRAHGQHNGR